MYEFASGEAVLSQMSKNAPFVSTSLGRVQARKLTREENGSHDSLTSHPLLSPPPTAVSAPSTIQDTKPSLDVNVTTPTTATTTSPKYVPYTPRHRVSTSQVTSASAPITITAQSTSPPSVNSTGGGATPQLQLQNLKAAAQNAQLTSGSVGWAICEKLCAEGESGEWEDIWGAVIQNKATMLLPLDQLTPQEVITPDYVRDHIVYCTAPSNKVIPLVTLSGLRGTLTSQTLTLRSTLATTSPQFQALQPSTSRISALAALPPLPSPLIVPLKPEYPVFNIPAPQNELPFPSQPLHKPQPRAVLSTPRLNPFAGLFGRPSPATTPVSLPPTPVEEAENKSVSVDVPIYVIQGRIIKKDVLKGIATSLKAELKEALTGLPPWLIDRTLAFTTPFHPVIPGEKKPIARQSSINKNTTVVELDMTDQTTVSDSFQAFYASLEEELRVGDGERLSEGVEEKRYQTVERIERAVCGLFYDRLFRQKTSDDASHDEALASRIAALNMLDLGLEHLGIDVGKAKTGVQAVVTSVGQLLQRLQDPSCRSPVDKASTIVAAHNAAVEGLSKLPPIRLKPDDEMMADDPTPIAAHFKHNASGLKSPGMDIPEVTLSTLPEESRDPTPEEEKDASLRPEDVSPIKSPESQLSPLKSPDAELLKSPDAEISPIASNSPSPEPEVPHPPTQVASDLLLPFMIYSIVKANPPELVSHLLYIQRYRTTYTSDGEEQFCLINLLAVVEFLENVDLAALGLADSARVLSVADLAPLPIRGVGASPVEEMSAAAKLRGRVNQQVEELAGSANKVISGVVDSSFSALRGLLSSPIPGTTPGEGNILVSPPPDAEQSQALWNQRPGFGLLRRGTEFTLASVTSSLPALHRVTTGGSRRGNAEETGQMLLEVPSRPESIKVGYGSEETGSDEEESDEEEDHDNDNEQENEQGENEHGENEGGGLGGKSDVRSVRSFGSMMSGESRDRRFGFGAPGANTKGERLSLSDRLANVGVRSRLGKDTNSIHAQSPSSRRISLLGVAVPPAQNSRPSSPLLKIPPPNERFLDVQSEDLRISEVSELLIEYRRVVEGLRALGGFEE